MKRIFIVALAALTVISAAAAEVSASPLRARLRAFIERDASQRNHDNAGGQRV